MQSVAQEQVNHEHQHACKLTYSNCGHVGLGDIFVVQCGCSGIARLVHSLTNNRLWLVV
jgi:hypothetical protein